MTMVASIFGAVLIFLALRDIFHQSFNPTGGGSLSRVLMRLSWGAFRWLSGYR